MKRMAPPARATPSPKNKRPVSAAESPMTIITGARRSSGTPSALSLPSRATTSVAVTATVAPSGPAMAKGRELRAATKAALMAVVRKVAAMP